MSDRPYRVSACAADCSGVAHSEGCPTGIAYWSAHFADVRARAAHPSPSVAPDDATIRFSLMELD